MLGAGRRTREAALAATQIIPIIALFTDDPVASGLIKTLGRPGRNLTGVTFSTGPEFQGKRLQLLVEIAPNIKLAAFLAPQEGLAQYRGSAPPIGVSVIPVPVDVTEQYNGAFAKIIEERADALVVLGGINYNNTRNIVAFADRHRLPTIYGWSEAVRAGGLMSYGTNVPSVWRQAARPTDQILKCAKPGEVPVEQPTKFELAINLKAAKALSLTIPPTLLAQADEVLE